MLNRVCVCKLN